MQLSIDDVGEPLASLAFVIVDLETTGGSADAHEITEIGAVRCVGGEVVGEFQTLVDPGRPIPPFIAGLTGITDEMVSGKPHIDAVLPMFLEFARGAVLVAHNARFDIGFLKRAAQRTGHAWPKATVVDTVALARAAVSRDEVPNYKLGSLAPFFRATTVPDHRALSDARATADVLHGILERLGARGVLTLPDLVGATDQVSPAQRAKRHLADQLPTLPGVYRFVAPGGRVLYVGTSRNIRNRVRSYFTAAEKRRRMSEMVGNAERVIPIVCLTPLEAGVRELRLIAEHRPQYNRRSVRPDTAPWLRLEPGSATIRLVRTVRDDTGEGVRYLGPFASRKSAISTRDLVLGALAGERNRAESSTTPGESTDRPGDEADVRSAAGRGNSPADALAAAFGRDPGSILDRHLPRLRRLADLAEFERAAALRDDLAAYLRVAARTERLGSIGRVPEIIAGRPWALGGWELVLVRHGRFAGTSLSPRGADPQPYIDALRVTGETVAAPHPPLTAATPEESELVLAWLGGADVRLVHVEGTWDSSAEADFSAARLGRDYAEHAASTVPPEGFTS